MDILLIVLSTIVIGLSTIAYLVQEKFMFYPQKDPSSLKYHFPFVFEELYVDVDSQKVHALHFKANNPKGVILYFHGNAGSLSSWGGIYYDIHPHEYDLVIFDYYGYGKSTGDIHSEKDLLIQSEAMFEYTKSKYPIEKIILYGRSLGSGLAVYLGHKYKVKKIILETPYNSFSSIIAHHLPAAPKALMKYKLNSEEWITNIETPIYIFHGDKDTVIPIEYARKLAAKAKPSLQFYEIKNADHNNIGSFPIYQKYLKEILAD